MVENGVNRSGFREYTHTPTGIMFVLIPGGEYVRGYSKEQAAAIKDALEKDGYSGAQIQKELSPSMPDHVVRLSPFLIGKTEVSQGQWSRIMGHNPSERKGDNLPVEALYWPGCVDFCTASGLSLPTEAQWEYACRGATTTLFYCGDDVSMKTANCYQTKYEKTLPVGSLEPNPFGLYNMIGNVFEYCRDVYDDSYYASEGSRQPDPVETGAGSSMVIMRLDGRPQARNVFHVVRGTSFLRGKRYGQSARRSSDWTANLNNEYGFRSRFPCLKIREPRRACD